MNTKTQNSFRQMLIAATIVAGFATAARAAELPQVHVNYADLNVNSAAGATVLYQRIRNAADQVCATFGDHDLAQESAAKACKTRAVAEAVASVHTPSLTRVYEVKTGTAPVTQLAALR